MNRNPLRAYHPAARPLPASGKAGTTVPAAAPLRTEPRFLPSLFDRLQDDEPSHAHEPPDAAAPGRERMRAWVLRDLELLLGTVNLEDRVDRLRYPRVAASSLNYGLPPLAGGWAVTRRWAEFEMLIRRALLDFEPRLAPDSLSVRPLLPPGTDAAVRSLRLLRFEIHGEIRLQHYPLAFRVQTAVDLENSRITLEP